MNQELWNAFLHGQIMIQISSNEQANDIRDMVALALEDLDVGNLWRGNDFLEYPFVVIEYMEDDIYFLNGRHRPTMRSKDYPYIAYEELFADLEEVL